MSTLLAQTDAEFDKITKSKADKTSADSEANVSSETEPKRAKTTTTTTSPLRTQIVVGVLPGLGGYDSDTSSSDDGSSDGDGDELTGEEELCISEVIGGNQPDNAGVAKLTKSL